MAPVVPGFRGLRRALIACSVGAALALSACQGPRRTVVLDAEGPLALRLERLVAASPLPDGWTPAAKGNPASAIVSLAPERSGDGPSPGGVNAGRLWLAPALPLADARFSLSEAEAKGLGLEPLDAILAPRRAVPVDGRWPGEEGYPFVDVLFLSVRAADGSLAPRTLAAWAERAAATARAAESSPATLCAVGDIQAGPAEGPILASGGARLERLFRGGLLWTLRSADLLVGNLEGAVSARGSPNPRKRFLFRMPPGSARALEGAGFDLVLFANNHAFDYGSVAFEDTLAELEEGGLPYVGAGRDHDAAVAPRRLDHAKGSSVLFLGFASYPRERLGFTTQEAAAGEGRPGINADEKATVAAISAAAAAGETVVVLAHGGDEYVAAPPSYLRERYRRFARAGAALVLGSHPHVLQGAEVEGSSLIAYSLGNFLFTGLVEPPLSVHSAALDFLVYEGRARGLRLIPVLVAPSGTAPDPDRASAERRFASLCSALSIR